MSVPNETDEISDPMTSMRMSTYRKIVDESVEARIEIERLRTELKRRTQASAERTHLDGAESNLLRTALKDAKDSLENWVWSVQQGDHRNQEDALIEATRSIAIARLALEGRRLAVAPENDSAID